MNFEQVKELINLINDSELAYFEATIDNGYIKMDKSLSRNNESSQNRNISNDVNINKEIRTVQPVNMTNTIEAAISEEVTKEDADCEYIKSPMVGTFYQASSPEAEPFVVDGDEVKKGKVVCIIEAMKLMNEIIAEENYQIISVMVDNGTMVEYGQPLFKVKKK